MEAKQSEVFSHQPMSFLCGLLFIRVQFHLSAEFPAQTFAATSSRVHIYCCTLP